MKKILLITTAFLLTAVVFSGCSIFSRSGSSGYETAPDLAKIELGVAPHVWEEPMVDVIDVPPGLDPEGHYYGPSHKEVVEVRQGKWKHYQENRE